jgi:Lrp/AsnC family transcriptional regulator for asnA, asnC and gidA
MQLGAARSDGQNRITLDDVDREILQELQADGRRAFRDIARQLGVSEATIRTRVKRLRDNRVLQILGYVDPVAFGYGIMVVLLIKVTPDAHASAIETFTSWRDTTWVSTTVGRSNIYVQMLCHDSSSLYDLLTVRLGDIDGIVDVDVIEEVKVHKAEYRYSDLS